MKINSLEMEWTDTGCNAKASGFSGVMLTCPRCQELLPRDTEHRCGDQAETAKKAVVTGMDSLSRRHPNTGRSSTGS